MLICRTGAPVGTKPLPPKYPTHTEHTGQPTCRHSTPHRLPSHPRHPRTSRSATRPSPTTRPDRPPRPPGRRAREHDGPAGGRRPKSCRRPRTGPRCRHDDARACSSLTHLGGCRGAGPSVLGARPRSAPEGVGPLEAGSPVRSRGETGDVPAGRRLDPAAQQLSGQGREGGVGGQHPECGGVVQHAHRLQEPVSLGGRQPARGQRRTAGPSSSPQNKRIIREVLQHLIRALCGAVTGRPGPRGGGGPGRRAGGRAVSDGAGFLGVPTPP